MKILIVGAGPAGLACAEQILVQSDADVTVVDKKQKVGENPRCAGGISLWMAEKVGLQIPSQCVVANIRRVRMYAPNGDYWELKGEKDYGHVIDRQLFEQSMAERVELLGGKIQLGHMVSENDLYFWFSNYDVIVGADGYPSVVSAWAGVPQVEPYDVHHCFQKEILWDEFPSDTIELYFGKVAPKGYLWLFSAGNGRVRAGLGTPLSEKADLNELLDGFLQRQTYHYQEVNKVAKLIPTAHPRDTNTFLRGRALLVGDAGLFCDPATGGGIVQGIASGKAAGLALAEGVSKNYDQHINWLRKQNRTRYRLKQILYTFTDDDLNELIQILKGFKPKTMSVGNELRRAAIHLVMRKPKLLRKFLKVLR